MNEIKRTVRGGTHTTDGFIPHYRHPSLPLSMPVKLKTFSGNPEPLYRNGELVYMLPGGREFDRSAP